MKNKTKKSRRPIPGSYEEARLCAKERARTLLSDQRIRSTLTIGLLLALLASAGIFAAVRGLFSAFDRWMDPSGALRVARDCVSAVIEFVFWFFAVAPLIFGLRSYAHALARRSPDSAQTILSYYQTSQRRAFAYRRSAVALLRLIGLCAALIGECRLALYLGRPLVASGDLARAALLYAGTLFFVLASVFTYLYFATSGGVLFALADAHPEYSYRYLTGEAERIMRSHRMETMILYVSFLPHVLLSLLTGGVYYALFAYPYLCLTMALSSEKMVRQGQI